MPRGNLPRIQSYDGFYLDDPYLPAKGWPEPSLCSRCSAVYLKKHWAINAELNKKIKKEKKYVSLKCPACQKIEDGYFMGVVSLSGKFIGLHKDDLLHLIKNEETRAIEKNPLERIIKLKCSNSEITVETTTESLALRIGRVLNHAYHGKTDFKFGGHNKFVRVNWMRD